MNNRAEAITHAIEEEIKTGKRLPIWRLVLVWMKEINQRVSALELDDETANV
ncbi:hypothetical protein [Vibrio furnissii]|uniref:hypothetical protein n=1 Tax=Vibrio furnissii TaxID=29494 RepID=UPI0023DB9D94|nr:hypothetical protein [Vibrio furnissii]ELS8947709.1 hypothetical protein [Vibrio fluvialis]